MEGLICAPRWLLGLGGLISEDRHEYNLSIISAELSEAIVVSPQIPSNKLGWAGLYRVDKLHPSISRNQGPAGLHAYREYRYEALSVGQEFRSSK